MAAAKKQAQAPIDRPLSRAYLREFKGWSAAYPPGLSDPTSLREMENVQVTREGGARVRPALRSVLPRNVWLDTTYSSQMVGGFEHFFLNDGTKALLFAARQSSGVVAFRVAVYNKSSKRYDIKSLTSSGVGFDIPQGESTLNFTSATTFVKYLQIDNKILALSDGGEDLRIFTVGATKKARKVTPITVPAWSGAQALTVRHPTAAWINSSSKTTIPAAQSAGASTLISSTAASNTYNFGFFYTFENEIGESAPSQTRVIKAARGWSQWEFFAPNSDGGKGASVTDPLLARDQLVAYMPQAVFNSALAQSATKWNLYMFTWSDQDSVPAEAILVGSQDLTNSPTYQKNGWVASTAAVDIGASSALIPSAKNRRNFSNPSAASQGLVAGDRLILVNDRKDGALIRWSSNQVGEYTNFTPSKNGGYKTLTSGNLLIPATVKLWQNPQSVDTITILCSGVDGASTSFYMAPSTVTGQTSETVVMGFEETTATPGTVSPYGVEVLNNALYHPLDTELMKSTANNYNINHTTMTDDISNKWLELENKQQIISTSYDNRLYYLVQNPEGEPLRTGCNGNEIWVYDAAQDQGSWSRWLVQGISLQKLEVDGKLYLALSRPEGIFVFDEFKLTDDISGTGGVTQQAPIKWKFMTNTQGANRAHDTFAHIRQLSMVLGNWRGSLEWGIRSYDAHGKPVEILKRSHFDIEPELVNGTASPVGQEPFDFQDSSIVRRDLEEWFFFARSAEDATGAPLPSYGQISYVEYRFTPQTVNLGTEFGSLETFEYDLSRNEHVSNTINGIPIPFLTPTRE